MGRGFGASLLTALFLATGALASEPGTQCLQAVLNAAGYDAGPEDGAIGPRTRAALRRFREDTPLPVQQSLSYNNAVVFCRLAGEARPELKGAWPARAERYNLRFEDDVDAANRRDVQTGLALFEDLLDDMSFPDLPLTVEVHVVGNNEDFRNALKTEHGFSDKEAELWSDNSCLRPGSWDGVHTWSGVLLCLGSGPGPSDRVRRQDVWRILAHELFHDAETQLAGRRPRMELSNGMVSPLGPAWFREGSAVFIELAMIYGLSDRKRIGRSAGWFSDGYRASLPPLEELRLFPLEGRLASEAYDAGVLAVYHLTDRGYESAIPAYYKGIGLGLEPSRAFEAAFDIGLMEFMDHFAVTNPSVSD